MRVGIELECWLVDDRGALAPPEGLVGEADWIHGEFVEPLIEVTTPPCESAAAAVETLAKRLDRTQALARERDRYLMPLGVPATDDSVRLRDPDDPRIAAQRAVIGDSFEHARYCAGTHLHFEQVEPADQLRVLTAIDPAIALVTSTPYYRGDRVAACARPHVYRRWCYGPLPDHGRLWAYPTDVAEWRDRRKARYEEFTTAAQNAGLDRATIQSAFSIHDTIWSPVRLRDDLGTVEWRAPDTATLADLSRLTTDVEDIIRRGVDSGVRISSNSSVEGVRIPPMEHLRRHVDAAIEHGLGDDAVAVYLDRLGFDVETYRPLGVRVGGKDHVDAATARQLHRQAVNRLERDLTAWRQSAESASPRQDSTHPMA
ncbi:MAG: glutamate-cysteine ligase family protein [Salinirussus sp.]